MAKQQIIQEAIADANTVQAAAEKRAIGMFVKEFSPKIKDALASLITEEVSAGSDQPAGYNPEEDKDAIGATVPAGQNSDDMLDKGSGPEKIQEEDDLEVDPDEDPVMEADEIDDEEDQAPVMEAEDDEMDDEEPVLETGEEEVPPVSTDDEVLEIVDDEEDEVPPSIDEEEDPEDEVPPVNAMNEVRRKNRKLVRENAQLREAISSLQNKFKKIDLFNAKLAYAFKLMSHPGLTRNHKRQIAEAFDAAKSVRETKLIYKTMKSGIRPVSTQRKPLENRNLRPANSNRSDSSYGRLNELAGL